jgi:hypothetical protein
LIVVPLLAEPELLLPLPPHPVKNRAEAHIAIMHITASTFLFISIPPPGFM